MQHCRMPDKSAAQRLVQRVTGRDLTEYLREQYVNRRLTDQEIADELGVERATITLWRKQTGVDRAERKATIA